jgi:hypothetical protein
MSEYNPDNTTGTPIYYAMWDEFNVVVAPTPNAAAAAGQVQINYIIDPPHFTSTTILTYQNINNHYCCMVF